MRKCYFHTLLADIDHFNIFLETFSKTKSTHTYWCSSEFSETCLIEIKTQLWEDEGKSVSFGEFIIGPN